MAYNQRRRLMIDPKLQGDLVFRVACYWLACVLAVAFIASAPALLTAGEGRTWQVLANRALWAAGPSLLASLFLLPALLLDALRFSLRFAGPMKRLRSEVRRLADGQWQGPIKFRQGDYWHELAEEINRIALRIEDLEKAADETAEKQQPAGV